MSWDYPHFEKPAFAVWLSDWCEEVPPPDAVFYEKQDAEKFIAAKRLEEWQSDITHGIAHGERKPEDYCRDAFIMETRNCYVPVWNSTDDVPEADPQPIPEHLGTIVPPDAQFLATFFGRLSLMLGCLRNYQRSHAVADLNGALALAAEVAKGLEEFNPLFRELR